MIDVHTFDAVAVIHGLKRRKELIAQERKKIVG